MTRSVRGVAAVQANCLSATGKPDGARPIRRHCGVKTFYWSFPSSKGVNHGHMSSVIPSPIWMITVWSWALAAQLKNAVPQGLAGAPRNSLTW